MKPAAVPQAEYVPQLRQDLVFADGGLDGTGQHGMIIHDGLRHRFFRLPKALADVLQHWRGTVQDVIVRSGAGPDDIKELSAFLIKSRLVVTAKSDGIMGEFRQSQKSLLSRLVHGYLSVRVPLVNPEPFLNACLPMVRPLASRGVVWMLIVIAVLGLYFAGRQWDHFLATFVDFFSPHGALLYGTTLVGLKIFHELGHGFVARHFGCRVPVMGINFMVLTPMLYTEASDAWRLSSRWQRFRIGAAGVAVELALAAIALLLWAFLPDGPLRSACYFVAATAWVMSMLVNLSPFMRFDGYHMLVDATGLQGIGSRSFALASWQLRELLFQTGEPMPEYFAPGKRRLLIALALGTWIYRVFLFGGIALLVYYLFPKLVGLPLAVVEVYWFILKPIINELTEWRAMGMKNLLGTVRAKITVGALLFGFVLAALPLDRHVTAPAMLLPAREASVFAPESAIVMAVAKSTGDAVAEGELLVRLSSPEIDNLMALAKLRAGIVQVKLSRLAADAVDRTQRHILEQEQLALAEETQGLRERAARLVVRAAHAGIVRERMNGLAAGLWVAADQQLFHVVDASQARLDGLVNERESGRLAKGAAARFVAEDGLGGVITAEVNALGVPGGEGQLLDYLSSRNGGSVTTAPDGPGRPEKPTSGYLPLHLLVHGAVADRALRGTVTIAAEPRSLLGFAFGRVVTVLLRESGF